MRGGAERTCCVAANAVGKGALKTILYCLVVGQAADHRRHLKDRAHWQWQRACQMQREPITASGRALLQQQRIRSRLVFVTALAARHAAAVGVAGQGTGRRSRAGRHWGSCLCRRPPPRSCGRSLRCRSVARGRQIEVVRLGEGGSCPARVSAGRNAGVGVDQARRVRGSVTRLGGCETVSGARSRTARSRWRAAAAASGARSGRRRLV